MKIKKAYSQKINHLLESLTRSLSDRCEYVKKVGKLKKNYGVPSLDQDRWKEVLETLKNQAKSKEIPEKLLEHFFETIHKYALQAEDSCEKHQNVKEKDNYFYESLEKLRVQITSINKEITNLLNQLYCSFKDDHSLTNMDFECQYEDVMITYFNNLFGVFCREASVNPLISRSITIKIIRKL